MTVIYKPLGLAAGFAAGALGRLIFGKVWGLITDEEPPEPTTRETTWAKLLIVAVIQGVIMRVVRVSVDRALAQGWEQLTGSWPGEERPDPE